MPSLFFPLAIAVILIAEVLGTKGKIQAEPVRPRISIVNEHTEFVVPAWQILHQFLYQ